MRMIAVVSAILGCMGLPPIARAAYTTLDVPGSTETTLLGVSGNRIVGIYRIGEGNWTGAIWHRSKARTACSHMRSIIGPIASAWMNAASGATISMSRR